jgi:hypothetical protein
MNDKKPIVNTPPAEAYKTFFFLTKPQISKTNDKDVKIINKFIELLIHFPLTNIKTNNKKPANKTDKPKNNQFFLITINPPH